jgi:hypothetical protein
MRRLRSVPEGLDLSALAARVVYRGSTEHKTYPSFAGGPSPRSDATLCPPSFTSAEVLTGWLRDAMARGDVGAPWEGGLPRYVWLVRDGVCYEGRLMNQVLGEYKGYPLAPDEWPTWVDDRG